MLFYNIIAWSPIRLFLVYGLLHSTQSFTFFSLFLFIFGVNRNAQETEGGVETKNIIHSFLFMRKTKSFFFQLIFLPSISHNIAFCMCVEIHMFILFWPVKDLGRTGGPWIRARKYLVKKYASLFLCFFLANERNIKKKTECLFLQFAHCVFI